MNHEWQPHIDDWVICRQCFREARMVDLPRETRVCEPVSAEPDLQRRKKITVKAQLRALQIANRMAQLPERLQWEQHRDDMVLVLLDELDLDDE